ncbi:hypothetical protein, partial [Acinetobacter baumannii]|uniref:hypothetical protein n=1 Tax=Acinetobacter baumannii TaxID=470 RepID=UPI0038B674B5
TLGGAPYILEHNIISIELTKVLLEASEELSNINKIPHEKHLELLITSIFNGFIYDFINKFQNFSDVSNPKFYFEFFNIQN